MLGKVRFTQPQNRETRDALFPEHVYQCFGCPGVLVQMSGRKWTQHFVEFAKRGVRQALSCEERDSVGHCASASAQSYLSIQQKADSLCSRNQGASTRVLHELCNRWH